MKKLIILKFLLLVTFMSESHASKENEFLNELNFKIGNTVKTTPLNEKIENNNIPTLELKIEENEYKITPFTYSVNFMWINKELKTDQLYICPGDKEKAIKTLLEYPLKWAELNPRADINFWYDSVHTSLQAVQNTYELMNNISNKTKINFRDIRALPFVEDNKDVFSNKLPVYFRVDLARAIFLYQLMTTKENTYAIYGDLDMDPLDERGLFDEQTLYHLKKDGIVMAKIKSAVHFENGFQMMSCQNANLLKAMKLALIELNIERGKVALKQGFFVMCTGRRGATPMAGLCQIVFESYQSMFKYFYALDRSLKLTSGLSEYEPLDLNNMPLEVFGLDILLSELSLEIPLEEKKNYYKLGIFLVPTKEVPLPPAGFQYNDNV